MFGLTPLGTFHSAHILDSPRQHHLEDSRLEKPTL
jgi:hypothetical protein